MKQDTVPLAITGLGMVTSISHDAINSCAAHRCKVSGAKAFDEFEVWDLDAEENVPLTAHSIEGVTEGYQGVGRWLRMATIAITDLCEHLDIDRYTDLLFWEKTGFIINGPMLENERYDALEEMLDKWPRSLFSHVPLPLLKANLLGTFEGHAGIISNLKVASENISSERWHRAIIAGVDSYLDEESLNWLYENNRLKMPENESGLIPGECAACIMVESTREATSRGALIHGYIQGVAQNTEDKDKKRAEKETGKALSLSIRTSFDLAGIVPETLGLIVTDLNGEKSRAIQWGNTLVQLKPDYNLDHCEIDFPAESFGEIGAASGPVSVCVAASAICRGYTQSGDILVGAVSDNGVAGSFLITKSIPRG